MMELNLVNTKNITLAGIVLCLLLHSIIVFAAGFSIEEAASRLENDVYVIDATIDYDFSEVALEALENGVPLTVDLHIQVRRDGAWVWESDVEDFHFRRQLRFQPLASVYEVLDLQKNAHNSINKRRFVSRSASIDALGEIESLTVIKADKLKTGETYLMEISTKLDIEALPVPLRPTAYISSAWKLSSEWSQWRIRP